MDPYVITPVWRRYVPGRAASEGWWTVRQRQQTKWDGRSCGRCRVCHCPQCPHPIVIP